MTLIKYPSHDTIISTFPHTSAGSTWLHLTLCVSLARWGFAFPLQQGYPLEGVSLTDDVFSLESMMFKSALLCAVYHHGFLRLLQFYLASPDFCLRNRLVHEMYLEEKDEATILLWMMTKLSNFTLLVGHVFSDGPSRGSAVLSELKLVMETQVTIMQFDSAQPNVPMVKTPACWLIISHLKTIQYKWFHKSIDYKSNI